VNGGIKNLVCFALEDEARAFRKVGDERAAVLVTGIGLENSKRVLEGFLKATTPERVFTCGFAGGLNPQLKSGEVVFETSDVELRKKLENAGAKAAMFHCVPLIATTAAEKSELRRKTSADAVEMESEVIQSICRERGIQCATVRVISDEAGEDLPLDFNKLAKADRNIHYGKLMLAIAKAPGKIPVLMRLQKSTQAAAIQLARVLQSVIE
jgi:adenosylhomocysteine nucleosidase